MTQEETNRLAIADAIYGLAALLLVTTGYYRAVHIPWGKGWDFYSHQPLFWIKMMGLGVLGSASLFPTITVIRQTIPVVQGTKDYQPLSDKLITRLTSVINAELLAVASIPLAATTMARGVGGVYNGEWPVEVVGPVVVGGVTVALGYKYVKEALTWSEQNN